MKKKSKHDQHNPKFTPQMTIGQFERLFPDEDACRTYLANRRWPNGALCPRCGKGSLFSGFLTLAPRCERCGLDYSFADAGDGPAVFVILISGFITVGAALMLEVLYRPPYWVHALVSITLILVTTLLPLRAMKGLLIALQYHHKAEEGRLIGGDPP